MSALNMYLTYSYAHLLVTLISQVLHGFAQMIRFILSSILCFEWNHSLDNKNTLDDDRLNGKEDKTSGVERDLLEYRFSEDDDSVDNPNFNNFFRFILIVGLIWVFFAPIYVFSAPRIFSNLILFSWFIAYHFYGSLVSTVIWKLQNLYVGSVSSTTLCLSPCKFLTSTSFFVQIAISMMASHLNHCIGGSALARFKTGAILSGFISTFHGFSMLYSKMC